MAKTRLNARKEAVERKILRKAAELKRLFNRAVLEAQEENRNLGIPNWYSINGVIVSDRTLEQSDDQTRRQK